MRQVATVAQVSHQASQVHQSFVLAVVAVVLGTELLAQVQTVAATAQIV
jgi:hypothetical protein